MGWSFRKSIGYGPFRVNFSKSGVSYSAGVRGARLNFGPRGTYVNLCSHGISYRRKLSGANSSAQESTYERLPVTVELVQHIASADIGQLTDTDSHDFITELTKKSNQLSFTNWLGIFPAVVVLAVILFSSISSKSGPEMHATDSVLVRVTSPVGVNIRRSANSRSRVLKSAQVGQDFTLLDSSNRKWLKVSFGDSVGYIRRSFVNVVYVHHEGHRQQETTLSNPYLGYELLVGMILFVPLFIWLKRLDRRRFEMELRYDMDEQFQQVYQQFGEHFANFSRSSKIWQYLNQQRTDDYKRNAGAGQLIKRTSVSSISSHRLPLPYFITNVSIPFIKLSNMELYFLPERLLIKKGNVFAAVFYKHLHITCNIARFIEEGGMPNDALVVDKTWRYLNKSGGPDRRFNNNRQIPICAYSQYELRSDTGIYELLTTSKQGAMNGFADFLTQIGDLQSRMVIA